MFLPHIHSLSGHRVRRYKSDTFIWRFQKQEINSFQTNSLETSLKTTSKQGTSWFSLLMALCSLSGGSEHKVWRVLQGGSEQVGWSFSRVDSTNHTLKSHRFVPLLQGCGRVILVHLVHYSLKIAEAWWERQDLTSGIDAIFWHAFQDGVGGWRGLVAPIPPFSRGLAAYAGNYAQLNKINSRISWSNSLVQFAKSCNRRNDFLIFLGI